MMKNHIKIILLLLSALIMILLSGCGKSEASAQAPAPQNTEVPSVVNEAVPESENKTITETAVEQKTPAAEPEKQVEKTSASVSAPTSDEEEMLEYEFLDVTISCRTDFFEYVSEKEAVFDLLTMAQKLGYISNGDGKLICSSLEQDLQISLEDKTEEDGFAFFKSIRYGEKDNGIVCTFERKDRYDGSTLYRFNSSENYTISMDQILLLTYIMENMSIENPDPLATLYGEYFASGTYKFPI